MLPSSSMRTLTVHLDRTVATYFAKWARATDGSTSAALRRLILKALSEVDDGVYGAHSSLLQPRGIGRGRQISFCLKDNERQALTEAAASFGTTPANWIRSLAIVHLIKKPQWNSEEVKELRALFRELRAIGNNVNQIAHALNIAVQSGKYPPNQGQLAKEAAEMVRYEMRRIVSVMTGNFDYWGLPDSDRPTSAPGAVEREKAKAKAAEMVRKRRPRRRPIRFRDDNT